MDSTPVTCLLFYLFFTFSFFDESCIAGRIFGEVFPGFTASNLRFVDNGGVFMSSPEKTFRLGIINPFGRQQIFYLSVFHTSSNTIIWTANRDSPISKSDGIQVTEKGISIFSNTTIVWSTPPLDSPVSSLKLLESGNLILLDRSNRSLWESFNYPTDTIMENQALPVGKSLVSSLSDDTLARGAYRFTVTADDAILDWNNETYWSLSMDAQAFKDNNFPVEFLKITSSGFSLVSKDRNTTVYNVTLQGSGLKFAKLYSDGRFKVAIFTNSSFTVIFNRPLKNCELPLQCGGLGLCSESPSSNSSSCSCPQGYTSHNSVSVCSPIDGSSFASCDSKSPISFIKLESDVQYFSVNFIRPESVRRNLSDCRKVCSDSCTCLGFFYGGSSLSCYLLKSKTLGSFYRDSSYNNRKTNMTGFIKISSDSKEHNKENAFPIIALILLPLSAAILSFCLILAIYCGRRRKRNSYIKTNVVKLGQSSSSFSSELEDIIISGLPMRFAYEELESATDNFNTSIGSGGFGIVYKGILPDKTVVAVKKINAAGDHGKKEFFTEIAVIGNIRHVNLVRLKGFCLKGSQRLLVYEYMSRGSLDRSLFGTGPVLEWQERYDIALGTARGLAYLHRGCDQKIIHCDVKPENILLNERNQVKISDFGLSKLLGPEQSNLFTTMRGTRGYLAPEWLTNAAISDKSDVYSYGMLLLEIIRGRKNSRAQSSILGNGTPESNESGSFYYFPLMALELHENGRYIELADPRLEGRVTIGEVEKLVKIALCCVHEDPALRPSMSNVVSMLEGDQPVGEPKSDLLNFLRLYGRRFMETTGKEIPGNSQRLYASIPVSSSTTTANAITGSLSYVSSQEVSAPR